MPLLNDILSGKNRTKDVKMKDVDKMVKDTSKIMKKVFKGRHNTIESLGEGTFKMARYAREAFKFKCCAPRKLKDIEKSQIAFNHIETMLLECGGAFQTELVSKYGPEAKQISQRFVDIAVHEDMNIDQAKAELLNMITGIKDE